MGERYLYKADNTENTETFSTAAVYCLSQTDSHMHNSININESHSLGHFDRRFNHCINLEKLWLPERPISDAMPYTLQGFCSYFPFFASLKTDKLDLK